MDEATLKRIARELSAGLPSDAKAAWKNENKYLSFANDPVGFGKICLKEEYPPKIQELMLSVLENPITIAQSCNGYGKSHSAASIALWFYKCFEEAQVFTVAAAPESNLKTILWSQIGHKVRNSQETFKDDLLTTLRFAPRSQLAAGGEPSTFIVGVPIPQSGGPEAREARFAGKHSKHLLAILDEADAIDRAVFTAIESWFSGGFVRLLCLFNPRKKGGACYEMVRDGRANIIQLPAFSHPNVITGKDLFPGAVSRQKTAKRICEWTIPIGPKEDPDSTCVKVPDFLVDYVAHDDSKREYAPLQAGYRRIIDPRFYYMTMASFPSEGSGQLYPEEFITRARNRWDLYVAKFGETPPEGILPLAGLDVSDAGDDWNCFCLRYGGWVPRLHKWRGLAPADTAARAAELHKEYKVHTTFIDSIGIGADVPVLMRRDGCRTQKVDVRNSPTRKPQGLEQAVFYRLRDELYWAVRIWLIEDETACLPPDPNLLEQLRVMTYDADTGEIKVRKKDKVRDDIGMSPDELESLMFTFCKRNPGPKVRVI